MTSAAERAVWADDYDEMLVTNGIEAIKCDFWSPAVNHFLAVWQCLRATMQDQHLEG